MFKNKAIVIGLFSFLMVFSFIQTSEAELWELLVDVKMQKAAINPGETVVVTGTIVDHAYKPIRGAEVLIRAGSDTIKTFTDPSGVFRGEFKDLEKTPGIYSVNVVSSWYGMTGLSSTEFQIKGKISPVLALQEKLSTDEARNYLSSNETKFEKDPIGQILFKYYHGLLEELIEENKKAKEPLVEKRELEEQRRISDNLRIQSIEEFNPRAGTYGGYQYDDYINGLNPQIRDLVADQLNFTKNTFEDAQKIRDEILANGGTYEEARKAYLDMISIPKESLEEFNQKYLDKSEKSSEDNQTEENSESMND
ncbi:MAG: carboxypeptidase-like regulatory domain-containing protein [Nitrosopumilus sp.]|nr:carboxypeptidase-like regulatory domain-containing protein [Nitrosopumilus sp.]